MLASSALHLRQEVESDELVSMETSEIESEMSSEGS